VGHGTAVASIIAARPAAGAGLRGLAPAAKILPVRVSERIRTADGNAGAGDLAALAAGIREAVHSPARPSVINLSITTTSDDPRLREAVREALAADIVVIAAVGNLSAAQPGGRQAPAVPFPAAYPGVVGVGSIDEALTRSTTSSTGAFVDLVAPGEAVVGAAPGGGHVTVTGTSFAAAFVSASAALVRSRWPALRQAAVVQRLLASADRAPGPVHEYGRGVLNPVRALTEVLDSAPAKVAPTGSARATHESPHQAAAHADAALLGGGLLACAAAVGLLAALWPKGRRRRWRPAMPDRSGSIQAGRHVHAVVSPGAPPD
jgi:subtilisin family serine protease